MSYDPPPAAHVGVAPTRSYVVSTIIVAIPVIALLAVPLYSRREPVLFSFPMFYWWTFVWIALLSIAIFAAYRLIENAKAANDRAAGGGR